MIRLVTIFSLFFVMPASAATPKSCSEKGLFFDIKVEKVRRGPLGTKKVERPYCSSTEPANSEVLQRYYSRQESPEGKLSAQEKFCQDQGKSLIKARASSGRRGKGVALCTEDKKAFVRTLCLNHFDETGTDFSQCNMLLMYNGHVTQSYLDHTQANTYAINTGDIGLSILAAIAKKSLKKPCDVRKPGNSIIKLNGRRSYFEHVCARGNKSKTIKPEDWQANRSRLCREKREISVNESILRKSERKIDQAVEKTESNIADFCELAE